MTVLQAGVPTSSTATIAYSSVNSAPQATTNSLCSSVDGDLHYLSLVSWPVL